MSDVRNEVIFTGFNSKDEVMSFVQDMCNAMGYTSLLHPGIIYESEGDYDTVRAHIDINELERQMQHVK